MRKVLITEPWITDLEREYVAEAITDLAYIPRFENAFADYVNRKYAITLPSCTSAIHLSLLALGIGAGDEVIVPDITWIGSSAPITYVGAIPVFCDVDEKTWCIDVEALKIAITPRTKAIITVDLYGGMPEYDTIEKLACSHGINVIEDAAQAIGSEYKGRKAGSFGATSCFSFHGSKTISCGEGGMLVTDSKTIRDRVLVLRDHGRIAPSFYNTEIAYKYKMSSVQAGLGLAQLERIEELVAKKREIFGWYWKRLDFRVGTLNHEPMHIKNSYWMTTVILHRSDNYHRGGVMRHLKNAGIATRPFFAPLSGLPAYTHDVNFRVIHKLGNYGMNLPSGLTLTEDDVDYVCKKLLEILDE